MTGGGCRVINCDEPVTAPTLCARHQLTTYISTVKEQS